MQSEGDGERQVGRLTEIRGDLFVAVLLPQAHNKDPVGQIGTYIKAKGILSFVLLQVTRMWEEKDGSHFVDLMPLGEIDFDGKFSRGVNNFPLAGSPIFYTQGSALATYFDSYRHHGLELGHMTYQKNIKIHLDPTALFSRHLAILGQSGSGKSWTVTSLIQRTVKVMPRAHIILLDLHGEYGWTDNEGAKHSAFPSHMVRHLDARELEIPYWLLTYAELADLLVDRTDENYSVIIAYLRDVLFSLRKKANKDLGIRRLSVDSPVYFSLSELYSHFKKANESQTDFGKTKGPLFGLFDEFLISFQSLYNDARYDFLLKPQKRTKSESLEDLMRDFVGLGEPKRQITVIDLSPVPSDVRPALSAQIARLAFEFNYWNPKRRDFPILLVCEEAHQYIPREADLAHKGTRKAMERIAKEGRKYGVGLCVVSQRPGELSETVLSQCANYLCMRISNPDDQAYVRKLMPEGEQNMADTLTSLSRGEALIMGEASPLPARFRVNLPDPPPHSEDANFADSWRTGPKDLDVEGIVNHWWNQTR